MSALEKVDEPLHDLAQVREVNASVAKDERCTVPVSGKTKAIRALVGVVHLRDQTLCCAQADGVCRTVVGEDGHECVPQLAKVMSLRGRDDCDGTEGFDEGFQEELDALSVAKKSSVDGVSSIDQISSGLVNQNIACPLVAHRQTVEAFRWIANYMGLVRPRALNEEPITVGRPA